MSLYTYIPGRAELLDVILDDAYPRMPRAPFGADPWQARVRAAARSNLTMFELHPWAADVATLRPPLGLGQMAKYDFARSALSAHRAAVARRGLLGTARPRSARIRRTRREHPLDPSRPESVAPLTLQPKIAARARPSWRATSGDGSSDPTRASPMAGLRWSTLSMSVAPGSMESSITECPRWSTHPLGRRGGCSIPAEARDG